MRRFLAEIKRRLRLALTFLLFHTGALRLLSPLVNRFTLVDSPVSTRFTRPRRRRSNSFQMLLYHRVNDAEDPFLPATPTALFRKQMEYLAHSSAVCSLDDAVEAMLQDALPDNAVVITFDDGYRDNYLHAYPILAGLGLTATIFLTTGCIGSRRILWHDRVFRAFSNTTVTSLEGFGPRPTTYSLGTPPERRRTRAALLQILKGLTEENRSLWIDRLIERLAVEDPDEVPDLMMNWNEAREMHRAGISFGSHTESHPILSTLPLQRAQQEIATSKTVIEKELGVPITTFAYPNGQRDDFTDAIKDLVRQAGYRYAATTIFGTNSRPDTGAHPDLMELKRDVVWAKTPHEFAARMTFYKFAS